MSKLTRKSNDFLRPLFGHRSFIKVFSKNSNTHFGCTYGTKKKKKKETNAGKRLSTWHGVQRRMVLVDNFPEFVKLLIFALLLIYAT